MNSNQELWDRLREKGFTIGDIYVQTGAGPQDSRMYVVVDGVAMSFADARALDQGLLRPSEFAAHARQKENSR